MKKFFKRVRPSPQHPSMPCLNGSVIHVGDWIREWSSSQPRKRALIVKDHPLAYQELKHRAKQRIVIPAKAGIRYFHIIIKTLGTSFHR